MKKTAILIPLFFLLLVSTSTAQVITLPFSDDFESYPVGSQPYSPWFTLAVGKGTITTIDSHSGTKSLSISGGPFSSQTCVLDLGENYPDQISYEVYVKLTGPQSKVFIGFFEQIYNMAPQFNCVYFANGNVYFHSSDRNYPIQQQLSATYQVNQWYKVRAELDFQNLKASVYLNDQLIGEDIPMSPKSASWEYYGIHNFLLRKIGVEHFDGPNVLVDDFSVFEWESNFIEGNVINYETNSPIEGATVLLIKEDASFKEFTDTNSNGYFHFKVPKDILNSSELYLKVLKQGYGYEYARITNNKIFLNIALKPAKVLNVPYANQGASEWCGYTSLSMVLNYFGINDSPWKIADHFNATPSEGFVTDFFNISFLSHVSKYVSSNYNYSADTHTWHYFLWEDRLKPYIKSAIDLNLPIIFGIPSPISHVIVITGCDDYGNIFISDPSGALIFGQDKNKEGNLNLKIFPNGLSGVKIQFDSLLNLLLAKNILIVSTAVVDPNALFLTPLSNIYMANNVSNYPGPNDYYSFNFYFENRQNPLDQIMISFDGTKPFGQTYISSNYLRKSDKFFDYAATINDQLLGSLYLSNNNPFVLQNIKLAAKLYKIEFIITNKQLQNLQPGTHKYNKIFENLRKRGELEIKEKDRRIVWDSGYRIIPKALFPLNGLLDPRWDRIELFGHAGIFGIFNLSDHLIEGGYYCFKIILFDNFDKQIDELEIYFAVSIY